MLDEPLRTVREARDDVELDGIKTDIPFYRKIMANHKFAAADYDTHFLEEFLPKYE